MLRNLTKWNSFPLDNNKIQNLGGARQRPAVHWKLIKKRLSNFPKNFPNLRSHAQHTLTDNISDNVGLGSDKLNCGIRNGKRKAEHLNPGDKRQWTIQLPVRIYFIMFHDFISHYMLAKTSGTLASPSWWCTNYMHYL